MPRKRIYISSTYDDLLDYRQTAASLVADCGHVAVDSYAAGSRPTVEKCLEDVQSADVYLGIVGLRYGWVPTDGDPRSITHREFDAALGKPRLMFVKSSKEVDLAEPIAKFRESLPAVTHPVQFTEQDSFTAAVRKTLRKEIGIGAPVPELLPYLCNRSAQYTTMDDALWLRRQSGSDKPAVFVVHGDEYQSGERFLEVLVKRKMPEFRAVKGGREYVEEFAPAWPDGFGNAADFRDRLRKELSLAVFRHGQATRQELRDHLVAIETPIVIHTLVSTSEWAGDTADAVVEFFRFWDSWTDLRRAQPLIVCLRFRYEEPPGGLRFWRRRPIARANVFMAEFLQQCWPDWRIAGHVWSHCSFQVLDEFHRIPRKDADEWSQLSDVKEHAGALDLEPKIRDLYKFRFAGESGGSPRMEHLARELKEILRGG